MIIITLSHNQREMIFNGRIAIWTERDWIYITSSLDENNSKRIKSYGFFWMDIDSIRGEF